MIAIPAAFTRTTGEAHWHVLVRARAIETGSFVVAAAQGGHHEDGRDTFGHSMIVDPWGKILAEAGTEPGFIIAEIDPAAAATMRGRIPALANERAFSPPVAAEIETTVKEDRMIRYTLRCDKRARVRGLVPLERRLRPRRRRGETTCPHLRLGAGREGADGAAVARDAGGDDKPARSREGAARRRARSAAAGAARRPCANSASKVTENADYVGDRFAEEARKIHYKEIEARGIYGEATTEEAKKLVDEGIEFQPLPTFPEERN